MEARKCTNCSQPVSPTAVTCPNCGEKLTPVAQAYYPPGQPMYQSRVPSKDKTVAGLLGILLGGLGAHHFYLGNVGMGILYLIFSWTFIPLFLGVIEGIVYLATNDEKWLQKHPPRY